MRRSRGRVSRATIFAALLLVSGLSALGIPQTARAEAPPSIPNQFFGAVTSNGTSIGPGYNVVATDGAAQLGSTITDTQGKYGWSSIFYVNANPGTTIEFYVNGVKAQQTAPFNAGSVTNLDLTVSGAPAPVGTGTTITTSILGLTGTFDINPSKLLAAATSLSSPDARLSLSLGANTTVNMQGQSLTATTESSPPSPTGNARLVSAYNFQPNGATFSPAATLSIKYDVSSLPQGVPEQTLHIAYWTGFAWSPLPSSVSTQAATVTAQASHFTLFAILGSVASTPVQAPTMPTDPTLQSPAPTPPPPVSTQPAPTTPIQTPVILPSQPTPTPASQVTTQPSVPSALTVSDFRTIPSSVRAGEETTIVAAVSNYGSAPGSRLVIMTIDGVKQAEQQITLSPGETKLMTFTTTKATAGSYEITVGDKSGSFTVTGGTSPSEGFSLSSVLPYALGFVGLLIIIRIIVMVSRRDSYF
jgi:hypothetical protein